MPRVNGFKFIEKKDIWIKQHPDNTATVCGFDDVEKGYKPTIVRVRTDNWNLAKGLIPLTSMDIIDMEVMDTVGSKKDARSKIRSWIKKNDRL